MKVAIVKPPLIGHQKRGIGKYTELLIDSLRKLDNLEITVTEIRKLPENVDLYHFPYFDPFFITLPLLRDKPSIVTIHDLIPSLFPDKFPAGLKGKIKWYWQKFKVKQVEAIITDSVSSKHDVIKIMKVDDRKVYPVYLAPDKSFHDQCSKEEIKEVAEKYKLPEEFIIFVGAVNWNKNLPSIIKAATLTKTKLVIISRDFDQISPMNPWSLNLRLSQQLAKNNEYVQPVGFVSDRELNVFYKLAKALVFPSFYEGFGLPVVEAFAAGCPVITSDKGSLKEVVGDAAIIVNPYDVNDISRGIKKLINNPDIRNDLIGKGLVRTKKFTWEKTAEETYKVYYQVIQNQGLG